MLKRIFARFDDFVQSIREHTEALREYSNQCSALASAIRDFPIGAIAEDVKFLADSERRELSRRGHSNEF
jgi:hypothetical protein